LGALKRMLSAMFHRGILLAAISAIALLILAFFVAVVAYVLWPVTIAVIVIYAIGLVYTGRRYSTAYARLHTSTSISRLIELLQSSASAAR
jgi:membrane protein implicated in regulation of membrane protease activity